MPKYHFRFMSTGTFNTSYKVYGGGYMDKRFVIERDPGEYGRKIYNGDYDKDMSAAIGYMHWENDHAELPAEVYHAFCEHVLQEHEAGLKSFVARHKEKWVDIWDEVTKDYNPPTLPKGCARWDGGWIITYSPVSIPQAG